MNEKKTIFILLLLIVFFISVIVFFLDRVGIIQIVDFLPFLKNKNSVVIEDADFPTEVEKLRFEKWEEKLIEKEESLALREESLVKKENEIKNQLQQINLLKESIQQERKKIAMLTADWKDRQKKIADMANKVTNMPPEKVQEMMVNWRDFDIIEVFQEIDRNATVAGTDSITPYLLTLFEPQRRAEITRKMLLPPIENNSNN